MSKRARFEVSFALPPGALLSDARDYVLDAVASYRGSLKPPDRDPDEPDGDPMFGLDCDSVKVKRINRRKKRPCS